MMSPLRLASLNLIRRRLPTIVALVAIAASVACSGVLLRLYLLSQSRFSGLAHVGDAIVGAKAGGIEILLNSAHLEGSYPEYLPFALFESLRAQQTVHFEDKVAIQPSYIDTIIPFLYFGKYKNHRVIGTNESFLHRPRSDENPVLESGRWASGLNEAVIGSSVTAQEKIKIGDEIEMADWAPTLAPAMAKLQIVGVIAPTHTVYDQALFSNIQTAQSVLAQIPLGEHSIWGTKVLNYFLVYLKPGGFPALASLVNKRTVGQAVLVDEEKQRLAELTGSGEELGLLMVSLIILLGGLSVAAMMVTRFEAMNMQMAVLRAIGYEKKQLAYWLLWEGLILGGMATVLGLLVDSLLFPTMRDLLGSALPPPEVAQSAIFQSAPVWVMAICATTAASLMPLWRLSRLNIHEQLKGL